MSTRDAPESIGQASETLAGARRAGRPRLPEGWAKSVEMPVRTTPALREKADRLAREAGVSRNAWIESLIRKARR